MTGARLDRRALAAAALALVMAAAYVSAMRQQSDRPVAWFLALLLLGAAGASYGARVDSLHHRSALLSAGGLLATLGVLAIFTIGAPVLAAGLLCLSAAGSSEPVAAGEPGWRDRPKSGLSPH